MGKTIYIDDGDALNIDRVIVNMPNTKWCKVLYSCDLIDKYEDRLKADMVATLTKIQLEIDGLCIDNSLAEYEEDINRGIEMASDVIQQKIDKLKSEQ